MRTVLSGTVRPAGTGTATSKQRGGSQTAVDRAGAPRSAPRTAVSMTTFLAGFMQRSRVRCDGVGVNTARPRHRFGKGDLPDVLRRHPVVTGGGESTAGNGRRW